ncbi:hypothetical protein PSYJA_11680, partial [Pseudomonas syringae pv. japonica str. M301072]
MPRRPAALDLVRLRVGREAPDRAALAFAGALM